MRKGLALLAAAFLVASGCSRCAPSHRVPPERYLPADAASAVVIPRLRTAQEQAAPFLKTLLGFPIAADLADKAAAVRGQLGFDPLDPKGLDSAGIDPDGGAALGFPPYGPPLLVLPVADARRLEVFVARVARERLGGQRSDSTVSAGRTLKTWSVREGAPPVLTLLVVEGTALLALGEGGPARVEAAVARSTDPAPAPAPIDTFTAGRSLVGEKQALFLFAPASSPAVARFPLARDGAVLGVTASATRLALHAGLLLPAGREEVWRSALGPDADAGGDALGRLPSDAFLVARLGGDPAALGRRALPHLPAAASAIFERAQLDLRRDFVEMLEPGVVASLSLAPTFDVTTFSRSSADLVGQDLFRLVHLAAVLHVKDAEHAAATLDRLGRAAPQLGFTAAPRAAGAKPPQWRFARGATAIQLALDGKRLLLAGGAGRLEALLAKDAPRYRAPTDASSTALKDGSAGVVLDFGQLVTSFRALPAQAYGTGPDAFVMRSLAERFVDPASRLVATSTRLELAKQGVRAELVIEARPPEGGK